MLFYYWALKKLLALIAFSVLLLVPVGTQNVFAGNGISAATTTWVGAGDGQNWSDINNWDRQVGIRVTSDNGFTPGLPQLCDLVIIDNNDSNPVTVHFNIPLFQLGNEMEIGSDDTFVIDGGSTFDHTPALCQILNLAAETIVNNGNFNVFGTLINNGAFINNGLVLACGSISGSVLPIPGSVSTQCAVGGELIPLDTTALLVAGAQNSAAWMIPVIVSAAGIGLLIQAQKTKLKHNSCPSCKLDSDEFFTLGDKTVGNCDNPKCRVSLFYKK